MSENKLNTILDWYKEGKLIELNFLLFAENFANPSVSFTDSRSLIPSAFAWLYENDIKFLFNPTVIPFKKKNGKGKYINRVYGQDMIVLFKDLNIAK